MLVLALSVGLVVMTALSLASLIEARRQYRHWQTVRLDPLGLAQFDGGVVERKPGTRLAVFFGDSRAEQWPAPEGLPGFAFANRGIGGQSSAQVLLRFGAHITPLKPDLLIVQVGINDLTAIPVLRSRRDAIVTETIGNIRRIVAEATSGGATVVLTTIFPTGPAPLTRWLVWSDEVPQAITEVNQAIRTLAGPRVIIFESDSVLSHNGRIRAEYAADILHLTPAGYRALNRALVRLLEGVESR